MKEILLQSRVKGTRMCDPVRAEADQSENAALPPEWHLRYWTCLGQITHSIKETQSLEHQTFLTGLLRGSFEMFVREVFIFIYGSLNCAMQENEWKKVKIIPIPNTQIRAQLENKDYPRKAKLFLKWLVSINCLIICKNLPLIEKKKKKAK